MAKVWFTNYGWRECATWECVDCKNFWTAGMDLVVEESKKRHLEECKANPEKKAATLRAKLDDVKRYVAYLQKEAAENRNLYPEMEHYYAGQSHILSQLAVWLETP